MGVKECERGLKNERLGDKKADAGEGENREAGEMLRLVPISAPFNQWGQNEGVVSRK